MNTYHYEVWEHRRIGSADARSADESSPGPVFRFVRRELIADGGAVPVEAVLNKSRQLAEHGGPGILRIRDAAARFAPGWRSLDLSSLVILSLLRVHDDGQREPLTRIVRLSVNTDDRAHFEVTAPPVLSEHGFGRVIDPQGIEYRAASAYITPAEVETHDRTIAIPLVDQPEDCDSPPCVLMHQRREGGRFLESVGWHGYDIGGM